MSATRSLKAFTLVELLVVIGIIALLISILLPSLAAARGAASSIKNLSNLRQLGIGLDLYKLEYRGYYPRHSSIASETTGISRPRTRWVDDIYPFMHTTEVYISPSITGEEWRLLSTPFAHTCNPANGLPYSETKYFGGYGYNFQYLGNARKPAGISTPFHANTSQIRAASRTIAISDTHGSKNGTTAWTKQAVYAIDPPLMSVNLGSRGSRRSSGTPGSGQYGYTGGNDGDPNHRSTPAERNRGKVGVVFCDGHAEAMTLKEMDDSNGDGIVDNGLWNGKGDPNLR
jgi:prepilin-type N-terminal cleavage/methylation domain-containing protein/prepilin-type processing-associated H-X9-DG protein